MLLERQIKKTINNTKKAVINGDIPIAAVIYDPQTNKTIYTYNQKEYKQNPLAHAEILAIQAMAKYKKNWRLDGCIMYVTLEPCDMCKAAIKESRISKIYYGTASTYYNNNNIESYKYIDLNQQKCRNIIQNFFRDKRKF